MAAPVVERVVSMTTDDEPQAIGAKVRGAREARGWTLADLAERAGVAPNTANALELGRKVRPGSLRAVLEAVEILPERPDPGEIDGGVRLAKDLIQTWLEELPPGRRVEAVQELTKFVMLYRGK